MNYHEYWQFAFYTTKIVIGLVGTTALCIVAYLLFDDWRRRE